MFAKSARFYDALYRNNDCGAACRKLHELIQARNPNAATLLDVACGTGKHVEHLQHTYHVEGLDINKDFVAIAQERCPEVAFHQGDMIDFKLNRSFDVVTCLYSSIGYIKKVERLESAISNMSGHLNAGGMLIVEPWFHPGSYWAGHLHTRFVDEPKLKIAQMYKAELEGTISIFDINYLVATPDGVEYFSERHEQGLFTNEQYMNAFERAGLETTYDATGLFGRGIYVGLKPQGERRDSPACDQEQAQKTAKPCAAS